MKAFFLLLPFPPVRWLRLLPCTLERQSLVRVACVLTVARAGCRAPAASAVVEAEDAADGRTGIVLRCCDFFRVE